MVSELSNIVLIGKAFHIFNNLFLTQSAVFSTASKWQTAILLSSNLALEMDIAPSFA